ncbi:MAG: hypothetical protein EKK55_16370 [Rhodocyclaceae bacterium]|nr:MAG: hypothetical protein EKK55_16370 [Rhodocyclaceae bacterium]
MRITLVTDRRQIVAVVLASDPSVAQANAADPMALFRYRHSDSDADALTVPDDATVVRFRPIQDHDIKNAETLAGRVSQVGGRLYMAALAKASEAHTRAVQTATLEGKAPALGVFDEVLAAEIDKLTDDEAAQVARFRAWQSRRAAEIVRRAVVEVVVGVDATGAEDLLRASPAGFPVEDFAAAVEIDLARGQEEITQRRLQALTDSGAALRVALEALGDQRGAVVADVQAGRYDQVPEPVREALAARDAANAIAWHGATRAAEIIEEIADHVLRVSRLGKGGLTCSSTRSGAGTATT